MYDLDLKGYAKKRAEALENYIACYINEIGLGADEIILVEQKSDDGLRIEWHCEPKTIHEIKENKMTETMRRIPVICANRISWKIYVEEYLLHSDIIRIGPDSYINMGVVYYPVLLDNQFDKIDKIRGIGLTKAIIYQCRPPYEFMAHLIASFRGDQPIDIDTITRFVP